MNPFNGVRWLEPDPVTGNPVLRIRTGALVRDYEVDWGNGTVRLWRLDEKTFSLVCRTIATRDGWKAWRCDCEDATKRKRDCKHVKSLQAAILARPF